MSQPLIFLNTKSFSHTLAVYVPDNWDYWTMNGKRVNFGINKINNPEYPNFTGISIVFWIFKLYCVWRKK